MYKGACVVFFVFEGCSKRERERERATPRLFLRHRMDLPSNRRRESLNVNSIAPFASLSFEATV